MKHVMCVTSPLKAAFPTSVNDQITDAVTQANRGLNTICSFFKKEEEV